MRYRSAGPITWVQIIAVLLSSLFSGYIAVMERILEIIKQYKYLQIHYKQEIQPGEILIQTI